MPETDPSQRARALFEYCASRPGGVASRRWGEVVFAVRGRSYAFLGTPGDPSVTVRLGTAGRARALEYDAVTRARFLGRFGWVTVRVPDRETLELAFDLIDQSHTLAAGRSSPKRHGAPGA